MRKQLVIGLIAGVVIIGGAAFAGRDWLRQSAFDLTGEEDVGPQVLGMAQLTLNLSTGPLDTRSMTRIDHVEMNPYGINTFLQQEVEESRREESMRLIAEAGFKWIRQEFPWQDIEIHARGDFIDKRNNPAGIDAWAKYDHIVELAEKYDVQIIARLSSPPSWSRAAGDELGTFAPPDDYQDFANYASAVATRYKGRISAYQVWNEPNIYAEWGEQDVNPEDYTRLLCMAYRAIKAADPSAIVLSGALAPTAELSGRDFSDYLFLDRMYRAGAGECFDVLTMQGYGLWSGPTDHRMRPLIVNYGRNQFIRDMMVKNGDEHKPIWISEMNWNVVPEGVEPRYGRVTLDQQARWAPLAYERAQKEWPWVGVIAFWYFKRADDEWLREQRPEAYFQMAEPNMTLMPVYDSMKESATSPPVMGTGNHAADHWTVSYSEGWRISEGQAAISGDSGKATFRFEGTDLRIVFGPESAPQSNVTFSVDGGSPIVVGANKAFTVWRGWYGEHVVEIIPSGDVTIREIGVTNDLPVSIQMALVAIVVIGVAALALSRKLPEQSRG